MRAQQVDVSEGLNWFTCGWELFKRSPGLWIALLLILAGIGVVLVLIPVLGQFVLLLISPALLAGLYHAARSADEGNDLDIKMLFEGFRDKTKTSPLLMLGALLVAVTIVTGLITSSLVGGSMLAGLTTGMEPGTRFSLGLGTLLGLLVLLGVELLIVTALFYAVPLVMLDNVESLSAVKLSFSGCLLNILPFLVFGAIYIVLGILAAFTLFLGYIVLLPVTLCAAYCSYKAVFQP